MRKSFFNVLIVVFLLFACGVEDNPIQLENKTVDTKFEEEEGMEEPVNDSETVEDSTTEDLDSILRVHYMDVGQGDATLIEVDETIILIDAGRHDQNDVVPYLNAIEISEIDLLVGTHPHADHIGQFPQVLDEFVVHEVWMSGGEATSNTFERTIEAILDSDATYYEPRAGENFEIGPLLIEVIHPTSLIGDLNNDSISLRLHYGQVSFLFTGDAEEEAEKAMIARGEQLSAIIYKAGHHGSSTSSTEDFISRVDPEVMVFSAGVDNQYGHPHQEVIELFTNNNIPIYGTSVHGDIAIETNGINYEIRVAQESDLADLFKMDDENLTNEVVSMICTDLNEGSLEELQELTHIGEARAKIIKESRPFTSISELTDIDGIAEGRLSDIIEQGLVCEP